MLNKINLLTLLLFAHKKRNLGIFFISTLLVMLLSSTFFISSSIQKELLSTLKYQADFTVQRYEAGRVLNTPKNWIDEFLEFEGVSNVQGRIYGTHYYEPKETHFLIVGVDFYEKQIVKTVQKLISKLNIESFLSRPNMILGAGVQEFFDTYEYKDYYTFRPPDRSKKRVYIYGSLPQESALMSNDMILMESSLAREILNIDKAYVSDIIIEVKNKQEMQKVEEKLILSHFNTRIIKKSDIAHFYKNLFNYKGGVFLTFFFITLLAFLIILYQRYSTITKIESQEIALLRMLGWKIKNIIYLKVIENFFLASISYLIGIILSYIFVYFLDAPLLKNIFLGFQNLKNSNISFSFYPDITTLALLYALFVIPFILAILIPIYKITINDISEEIR